MLVMFVYYRKIEIIFKKKEENKNFVILLFGF